MSAIRRHPAVRAAFIYGLLALAAGLIALLLKPVLPALILSFLLYALLQPLINRLVSRGLSASFAVGTVLTTVIVGLVAGMVGLFPRVMGQLTELQNRLPELWAKLSALATDGGRWLQHSLGIAFDGGELLRQQLSTVESWGSDLLVGLISALMQVAVTLLLVPLVAFFLLRDFRKLRNRLMALLPNNIFELAWLIYFRVARQLQSYLRGILLQSLIIAALATTGFWFIGMDMPFVFGGLTGLLNLIPYAGPLLALAPPLVASLGAPQLDAMQLLGIVLTIGIAQIVDNTLVVPAVIADTVDMHPLAVLLGIVVFGYLFGFIGMLVALPLMSASKIIFTGLYFGLAGVTPPLPEPRR